LFNDATRGCSSLPTYPFIDRLLKTNGVIDKRGLGHNQPTGAREVM
jgi:hypothetical protein